MLKSNNSVSPWDIWMLRTGTVVFGTWICFLFNCERLFYLHNILFSMHVLSSWHTPWFLRSTYLFVHSEGSLVSATALCTGLWTCGQFSGHHLAGFHKNAGIRCYLLSISPVPNFTYFIMFVPELDDDDDPRARLRLPMLLCIPVYVYLHIRYELYIFWIRWGVTTCMLVCACVNMHSRCMFYVFELDEAK